ncbi:MAG TPA: hypothetical protein VI454_00200 [Verrucomicrobiae bacterium]|jgi:hypothetical protein
MNLIRICLIVAIVAGLGAAGISHFQLDKKIHDLIGERDQNAKDRDTARAAQKTAEDERDKTKKELETTTAELTTTKSQLTESQANLAAAQDREKKATDALTRANAANKTMQEEVSGWRGLKKTLADVTKTLADYPKLKDERDTLEGENKILSRRVDKMGKELAELRGEELPPVELPQGLKGKIVQVDPKFDFVVLNIGGNDGVLERGELLINRKGRLIGKVRVSSVMPDKCVANVLRAWKQDEPFEGDEVLY